MTTGDDDGTGRRRLVPKDILDHKGFYDEQKIPLNLLGIVETTDITVKQLNNVVLA